MDVKENLAKNLISYRKSAKLTQSELAEKLNYSDKAVSKWERGESAPDISVLKEIADFYGVTIDTLISEPNEQIELPKRKISKKRLLLSLLSAFLVWLVATACFMFLALIFPTMTHKTWLSFIWAIPITFIVLLVLTSVWKKPLPTTLFVSFLVWTAILSLYLTLYNLITPPPKMLWTLFLVGIPLQILTIIWFFYRKVK